MRNQIDTAERPTEKAAVQWVRDTRYTARGSVIPELRRRFNLTIKEACDVCAAAAKPARSA